MVLSRDVVAVHGEAQNEADTIRWMYIRDYSHRIRNYGAIQPNDTDVHQTHSLDRSTPPT